MAANRGLNRGRGLSALIPQKTKKVQEAPKKAEEPAKKVAETTKGDNNTVKNDATPTNSEKPAEKRIEKPTTEKASDPGILVVRLTEVVPSRKQPRKKFDEEPIRELAESIREFGVVTPLLVRKKGDYYELIAGERRWRAAKLAGLKEVPVLLREFTEQEAMEIALIDNLQREDLNAIEEARAYQSLIDEYDLKQEEIARRVSKSRSAVTNALRLLKLDEGVQALLIDGKIQMGHARALLSLEDGELQRITAERIAETQISVRETEKLVKKLLNPGKPRVKAAVDPQIAAVYADLEEQLRKAVGTRVCIQPMRGKKGKVEIEYYSNEDLERIIDKLR